MSFTDEQKEALCLAAITYRKFSLGTGGWCHGQSLHTAISEGLENVPLTRGHWDVVWGPVAYRAPLSLVDDALMCVGRHRAEPRRHVVVIRGTNPISIFDWVFGDFWVTVQMPWPYGKPSDAKVSLSTALGLGLLQSMHSPPPPHGLAADVWRALDDGIGALLRRTGGTLLERLGRLTDSALNRLRAELAPFANGLTEARRARAELLKTDPIVAVLEGWNDSRRRQMLREVTRTVNGLTERHSGLAFALLAATTAHPGPGVTLLEFLRAACAATDGGIDVLVTGHSKGGGLASTAALWLAETQGTTDVEEDDQWDPERRAKVRCHSFAGPTAGNAAFAARSNAKLENACSRVVNTNDVVPHAWAVRDVSAIPELWGAAVGGDAIARLAEQITRDLTELELDYTHPDKCEPFTVERPATVAAAFLPMLAYHHFEAYFVGLGIREQVQPIDVVVRP